MAGTLVANTINTDTGLFSTNNAYSGIAKAWVNFTGSTPAVVNSSFNVSSVTRVQTGVYAINMTTAMPNTNYVTVFGSNSTTAYSSGYLICRYDAYTAPTTSSFTIETFSVAPAPYDVGFASVVVFSS